MEEKVNPQAKSQTPTNEGRKYVYDKLKEQGYNVGSYGEFDTAMSSDEDSRRWAYDELGKSGVDLGEYAEFEAGIGYTPAPKKPRQKHSIEEATTPKLGFPKLDSRMRMVDETKTPLLKTEQYLTQAGVQEDGTPIYDTKQRAELVPDFDPQNGGVTAPPAYLDVRTGKTIKAKDKSPEVQRAKEEAKRKPEQITDVERITRDSLASLDSDIDSQMSQAMDRIAKENADKAKDTKSLVGMGLAAAAGSIPGGAGMAVAANPFDPNKDAELNILKEAKRRLNGARNMIAEADHNAQSGTLGKWLESSFAGGAARGLGQKLFDARTWDMGLGDLAGNKLIKDTIDKVDAGKSLTKAELALLDALSVEMATNAYFGSYVGHGYNAGAQMAENMPFILEFALNPLSTTGSSVASKLARYAVKRYGLKVAKSVGQKALRVGARAVGDTVGSLGMTLTTGAMHTAADTIDRTTGDVHFGLDDNNRIVYDGHEQGDDLGTAIYKAVASRTIENYSEMFGNYFGPLLGGAGRILGKGASKIPYLRRATEFIGKVSGSQFGRMVDDLMTKTQWQGAPSEYVEEVAGNVMNALLVGDKDFSTDKGKGVFNLDDNIDTFLGVSLMSGAISMAKTVGYRTPTMEARKAMERSGDKALRAFGDPVRWGGIRSAIDTGNETDLHNAVAGVLRDKTATEEQKKAVLDYAKRSQAYRGMEEAKRNRLTESGDDATAAGMQASYENGYTLATPQQMSDAKNNLDYLTYKASSDLGISRNELSALSSEGNIDGAYVQGLRDQGYSDQQIGSVLDWFNAKATYDGMIQHAKDDIADQTQAIHDDIDANTAKDGTLRGATIEDGEGEKRVYIVDGNVSMLEDGSGVDKAKSDDNIIIRDPETGEVRFVHLSSIISADEVRDPEVEKARLSDEAKESIAGHFADQIEGKLPLAVGDVYNFATEEGEPYQVSILQDNGDGTMLVEANGEQIQMSGEELQAQADLTSQVRVRQYHEEEAQRQAELLDQERAEEGRPAYQLNDQIIMRTPEGGETIGYIQAEEDEDGRIEVWTDSPINGRRVQLFSRDELDDMVVQHTPAETTAPAEATNEAITRDMEDMDVAQEPEETIAEEVYPEPEGEVQEPEQVPEEEGVTQEPTLEDNTVLGSIPLDDNGEPAYESVPVSTSYDALMEQTDGDADMVDRVIDSVLSDKRAELKKVEASKVKHGSSVADKIRAEREREAQLEKARGDVAYWEQMKGEREERRIKESQNIDESASVEVGEAPEYHMDNGADARERGYVNVSGYRIDRQEPLSGALVGKDHSVKFATDVAPTAKYAVIDVRELQASHNSGVQNARHFIPEAQPKDRSGSVSVMRAESMARNIKPEEITGGATAYTGSPVVNSRGEVIQGNGRSDALRLMWSHNPDVSEGYKQYLVDHADKFGVNADAVRSMRSPVLVHMVDVSDSEAIRLGQYKMGDIETGGEERIDPSVTAQKMGSDIGVYASLLFASNEEGKSLSDLVSRNGIDVLQWMNRKGYISDNQYSSALNKQGALTSEAREDLKAILYQILFDGGHMSIKKDFDDLPKSAQNALLQTVHRAIGLSDQSGIITLLQKSIGAYAGLLQYETFRDAKSPEEISIAVDQWAGMQDLFSDRSNGEIFGNFALKLAETMRVSTQRKLASLLNELYDVVQGSGEDTLFEAAEATPKSLEEAVKQVFGLRYGDNGSLALADNSEGSESGGHGGSGETSSGEPTEGGEGTTERRGGTDEYGEEVAEATEEPAQNEVEGSEVSASEEVAEQPIDNTEVEEEAVPEEVETSPEGTVSEKEIVAENTETSEAEPEEEATDTIEEPSPSTADAKEEYDKIRIDQVLGDKFTITKDYHEKNDTTIWVVRHNGGYVDYKVFSKWMSYAKKHWNGYYSKYNGTNGFIFESLKDAKEFATYTMEEASPKDSSEEDKALVSESVGKTFQKKKNRDAQYDILAVDPDAGMAKVTSRSEEDGETITAEYRVDRIAENIREGRWVETEQPESEEPTTEAQAEVDNIETEGQNDGTEEVHIPASTSTGEREGGQEHRPSETLGEGSEHESTRTDDVGVDRRDEQHSTTDEGGSGGATSGTSEQGTAGVTSSETNWRDEFDTDSLPSSSIERARANIEAIRLSKEIENEGRGATLEEMKVLHRYSGWGGAWPTGAMLSQLESILTPEELSQAEMSRNSAYFTPSYVVDAMWDVARAVGFKGGRVLEGSAGIGNILGRMPSDLAGVSSIDAVEVDGATGRILSQLYPKETVHISGFEHVSIPARSVDLAITNVPFVTGLRVYDDSGDIDLSKRFNNIHDFCIAKNVRKLKEGGVGVFISSSGTLDNSLELRKWLVSAKGGDSDVVGAFRLNNATFSGTMATSDIIVVRKRVGGIPSDHAIDVGDIVATREASYYGDGDKPKMLRMTYNRYFAEHPENMGGKMMFAFENGDTYRPETKSLYPDREISQPVRLSNWLDSVKAKDFSVPPSNAEAIGKDEAREAKKSPTTSSVAKEGSIGVNENGEVTLVQYGLEEVIGDDKKVKGKSKAELVKSYLRIKDALSELLRYEEAESNDDGLSDRLLSLNEAYDSFVDTFGHLQNNRAISLLSKDVDFPSIQAIELYENIGDEKGERKDVYTKTDIFNKRVVSSPAIAKPQTIHEALAQSISGMSSVNVRFIAEGLGVSEDEARAQLLSEGLVFEDPITGDVVVHFEYTSGNVRDKLKQARANNSDGRYDSNISALEKVLPEDIPAHLIYLTLGSDFIPTELYSEFTKEKTGVSATFSHASGKWMMSINGGSMTEQNRSMGVRSLSTGVSRLGTDIILSAFTFKNKEFSKTAGKETITDKEATIAYAQKVEDIRAEFNDWMRSKMEADEELRDKIATAYNETVNSFVPMKIPDEYTTAKFQGATDSVTLNPHQAKAAIRATIEPVLLAHEVGTGKTFTLITSAMEMRRRGTAQKPLIVVQNATLGQFVASAKRLYPASKILMPTESGKEGRLRFFAQIKYNDWDMVIIPQSMLSFIPDSAERKSAFIQAKIEEKVHQLTAMRESRADNRDISYVKREIDKLSSEIALISGKVDTKQLAKSKQNADVRAREMLERKTDETYNFDALGIDAILVDEAHEYKRLGFSTEFARGVKGVDTAYSAKSQGLYLKVKSVLERSGGRNVVFATGTPVSNTAAEVWTFMKYLMSPEDMRGYGIEYFDDFVRKFGDVRDMMEFTTAGKYKETRRFSGYKNLPELLRVWSQVADTVLSRDFEELNKEIPKMEGGGAKDVYLPQSPALRSIMKAVKSELERYDKMSGAEKKENAALPLRMYGIAKAGAIDPRLVLDSAPDDPNSKTNETVRAALRSLEESKSYKGAVAIFSDMFRNTRTGFNLHEEIARKLIDAGVPESQIAVIRSGMSTDKKLDIFSKVNRGEIRVVIGSTFTLGTGVNIQERLRTLIHIDAPNRPMDYTQRNGRILRQGNLHKVWDKPVEIIRFGVEDSLDVTAYQRLKTKGAIADSVMQGNSRLSNSMEGREIEEEEDSFGDMVANLSGSEYALLKNKAEKDLRKLVAKRSQWEADQRYISMELPKRKATLAVAQSMKAEVEAGEKVLAKAFPDGVITDIVVNGVHYASLEDLGDIVKKHNSSISEASDIVKQSVIDASQRRSLKIEINGVEFIIHTDIGKELRTVGSTIEIKSTRTMKYTAVALGLRDVPVQRGLLSNALKDIEENVVTGKFSGMLLSSASELITRTTKAIEQMESRASDTFAEEEELEQSKKRVEEYEALMQKELAVKEAKYAKIDAEVEGADILQMSAEEDTETSEEDDDLRYRYTEREDGTLLSENAFEAEELGKFPKAKFRKVYGVTPTDFEMLLAIGLIINSEWHHTGKTFRETKYYSWADNAELDNGHFGLQSTLPEGGDVYYSMDGRATTEDPYGLSKEDAEALPIADSSLSEWYKAHKKEIKKLADEYKGREWAWETLENVPPVHFSTEEERTNTLKAEHFYGYEREAQTLEEAFARKLYWDMIDDEKGRTDGKISQETKDEIRQKAAEEGRIQAQALMEENRERFDQAMAESLREKESAELRNAERMKHNLSEDSKAGILLQLAGLASLDRKQTINKIEVFVERNSLDKSPNSSEHGYEYRSSNPNDVGNGEDSDLYDVASSLVRELGEKAYIVEDIEELEDIDGLPAKAISSKGWYNTRTGEVVVVLPNHTDEEDVARTVLHEVVGHKGIRAVVGDRSFEAFLDKVYKGATPEVRKGIIERSKRYGWNVRISTEEYIAELAERGFADREDQGMWDKIKEAFRDLISRIKLSLGIDIGDRELRYMLWRSWQMQQKGGIIGEAENISKQMELGVGNFGSEDNSRYRRGTHVPPTQGDGSLKEEYDNLIASSRYQMAEAVQDSMKSVSDVYKMILEKEGKPVDIEEVDGYENAYLGENRLSSVNQAEMEYFSHQVLKPFLGEVGRIVKAGSSYEEVTGYMMSLHGLERNRSMAFDRAVKALAKDQGDATLEDRIHREYLEDGDRIANEEAFEAKRISAYAYHKEDDRIRRSYVGDSYDEYRQMDYAGLTGMDSVYEDVEDAEQGALDRIREFEKKHDVSLLWKTKRGVTDATRGKLYETGMISKETDAKLRDMYRYYIPLRGFADGTSEDHYGYLGEARGSFAPAMKRAKGRKSQADDPIAQMSKMFESAVVQGNRNKLVKQKMLNFVMNHPSELFSISDLWLHYNDVTEEWEPVYPEPLPEGASHEEVEDHMREFEERMIAAKEANPSWYKRGAEARSIPYRVLESDLNEHQMIVKRGGRSIVVTINGNPRFAQAINGMSNPDSNMGGWVGAIFELGSKVNRVLSALYTTKNPDFLMSNIIRDMLYSNTMVWVKESPSYARRFHANIVKYNPVTLRRLLKKHKAGTLNLEDATERHFYQFMMNGGETGYTQQRDIEGHKNEIQRALVGSSGRLTAKKAFMLLGKLGEDLNRAVENVARFSAYVASRDEGRSIDRSIYDAKEISVNFNKKGAGSKFYNAYGQTFLGKSGALVSGAGRSFYVFWNAAVQGLSNYGRAVKKHPYKGMAHAATFFTLGVVIPLMAYMNGSGDGDDDYWDLPEYVRRSNICFNAGDGTWVTIPLPQEMRAVYGLGELAVSTISGKEHRDNIELTKAMVEQVTQVLPLDLMEGGGGLRALYPSFVKPLVEASDNVGWTGMPIYKDTPYNKSDPEWTKAYRSANSGIVWLSKTLNELTGGDDYKSGMVDINPAQVEYILKGYFGGAWSFANKLAKSGEMIVGDRSFEWNNIPLANRVIKTSDERTKFRNTNNEYYKYKKEAEDVKKLERRYEKSDNVLEYAKKIDELQRDIQYRRYLAFEDLNAEVELLQSALKVEDDPRKAEELTQALREAKKSLVDSIRNIK